MTKVVTHGGKYHTDDVFAVATLSLVYDDLEILRVKRKENIPEADFVVDIGQVYDEECKFDHHQKGGAGEREDGIPYASFGLVWKRFGIELCGLAEVSSLVDRKLVQPIDASDVGFSYFESNKGLYPYLIQDVISSFRPTWSEGDDFDGSFSKAVDFAKNILSREIKMAKDFFSAKGDLTRAYETSLIKEIITLDKDVPYGREIINTTLSEHKEPIYAIYYKKDEHSWRLLAISKNPGNIIQRKPLPEEWRGKSSEEMKEITGLSNIKFVHNSGFLLIAESRDSVTELAKRALQS
ncbi:MAG: MYG1 family protein [Candidatus Pacebacteria bacterium]|nr:MYG1 family protein [Candidatus Paceibacterota bacterium]